MADPNPYSAMTPEEIADSPTANPLGLSPGQLERLGFDCKREVDESSDAKGTLPDRWSRNTRLYDLDPELTNLNVVPGMMSYPIPLWRPKADEIINTVHRALTSYEPYCQLLPYSGKPDDKKKCDRVQKAAQTVISDDTSRQGFDRSLRMCLQLAANHGVSYITSWTTADGEVKYDSIDANDFVFYPHEVIDMKRAQTLGHKIWLLKDEIRALQQSGEYMKVSVGTDDTVDSRGGESESYRGSGQSQAVEAGFDKIKCYQLIRRCRFAPPGSDEERQSPVANSSDDYTQAKDYLIHFCYDTSKILKVVPWDYKTSRGYFDIRLSESYGSHWPSSSPGNVIQGLQLAYSDLINVLIQLGYAASCPETHITGEQAPARAGRGGPGTKHYHASADVKVFAVTNQVNVAPLMEIVPIIERCANDLLKITPLGTTEPLKSNASGNEAALLARSKEEGRDQYSNFVVPIMAEIFLFVIEMITLHFRKITKRYEGLGLQDATDLKVKARCIPTSKSNWGSSGTLFQKLGIAGQIASDPESGFDKRKVLEQSMLALDLPFDIESLRKLEPSAIQLAAIIQGLLGWIQWQSQGGQGNPPPGTVAPEEALKVVEEIRQGVAGHPGQEPEEGQGGVPARTGGSPIAPAGAASAEIPPLGG
jgi:hypothetical protein